MGRFAALAAGSAAFALGAAGSAGCSKLDVAFDEPVQDPFDVQVNVVSDPGTPVPDVELLIGTRSAGKTDASGIARVRFGGRDGDQVELTLKCPADYDSPSTPLTIPLRRLAKGSQIPRFEGRCAPVYRTVVVGVRADNGVNLPVVRLGRTIARTDVSGAALFTVRVKRSEVVEITLSTAEKEAERLRPQNPTLTFMAKDTDDMIVLDQTFAIEKKMVRAGPKPSRPTPLPPAQ